MKHKTREECVFTTQIILILHRINFAYQNRPSHVGKYVPLKRVCSRMPSTPPSAWIISVRQLFRFHNLPSWRWCVHQNGFCFRTYKTINMKYFHTRRTALWLQCQTSLCCKILGGAGWAASPVSTNLSPGLTNVTSVNKIHTSNTQQNKYSKIFTYSNSRNQNIRIYCTARAQDIPETYLIQKSFNHMSHN